VDAKFVTKFINIFIYLLYSIKSLLNNTLKRNPTADRVDQEISVNRKFAFR